MHAQIVSTIAGSSQGFIDANGLSAQFSNPQSICADAFGNLYVSDRDNHKIRKIDTFGNVTTFAGSSQGFQDDLGTNAKFSNPTGICIDTEGSLYVADSGNYKIRKISANGYVTTYAGSTQGTATGTLLTAQFTNPKALCFDSFGNLYVGDYDSGLKKISPNGIVSNVIGQVYINTICADLSGNIYYSYSGSRQIMKVSTDATISLYYTVSQIPSNTQPGQYIFYIIKGICFNNLGDLIISIDNHRILKKNANNNYDSTISGGYDGNFMDGNAINARFNNPSGLYIDQLNNIFIADQGNHRIRKITNNALQNQSNLIPLIKIYPNPASHNLTINGLELISNIEIYDNLGKRIYFENEPDDVINIEFLTKGIYLLKLTSDKINMSYKFIKE
jgi:sugar lactone lactonase YvrE